LIFSAVYKADRAAEENQYFANGDATRAENTKYPIVCTKKLYSHLIFGYQKKSYLCSSDVNEFFNG
jgi:hypothetical protein